MKIILKTVLIGIAGTFTTDIWTLILKFFGIHSHGLLIVGHWVTFHLPLSLQNQFAGKELVIGWIAHYCLGISFAFLLVLIYGKKWFQNPSVFIALMLGCITFVLSLFVIQPILGFGIAFSKYANQPIILLKVVGFHIIYSIGLYIASKIMIISRSPSLTISHSTKKMKSTNGGLLAAASMSVLLASLGTSIVNIALPSFTTYFSASFQSAQWVVIAYLLAVTGFVTVAGKLADRYGYRHILLCGIIVFTLSSFLSAFAPNILILVILRGFQGGGAAVLSTVGLILVKNSADKVKMGTAMGLMGTMSAIGTAMGPTLGGLLLTNFGWPSIFFFLTILGLSALLLGIRFVKKTTFLERTDQNIHFVDVLLLFLTVGTYALAMTISKDRFSIYTLILLLLSFFTGWAFFSVQRRRKNPFIASNILKNGALMGNFLVSNVMMTTLIVGPFFLTSGFGFNEATVGLVMSVGPVISIITGIPSGKIVDKAGAGTTMKIGLAFLFSGTLCLALLPAVWGWAGYISGIVLLTPGYQLFQAANNTSVMASAEEKQGGIVSGMLNLSRNMGLVTGASLMGAIFSISAKHFPDATGQSETMFFGLKITFLLASMLIFVLLLKAFIEKYKPVKNNVKP